MTAEGHALDAGDFELARKHAAAKDAGQEKLQQISSRRVAWEKNCLGLRPYFS